MHTDSFAFAQNKYFHIAWAIFLLLLFTITFILPFNGLYGQDSHEYFRFSRQLQSVLLHATPAGDFFYPVIYPLIGAILGFVFPDLATMQMVSLLSFFLAAWCLLLILENEHEDSGQTRYVFISVFFLCAPYLVRASLVIMSDMLALLFVTAALLQFQLYIKRSKLRTIFLFGLWSGLAVSTRYSAFVLVAIPILLLMLRTLFIKKKFSDFILLSFSLVLGFIPQFLIKGISGNDITTHPLWQEWSLGNMVSSEFDIVEGHLNYTLPNLLYPIYTWVHPGFFIMGLPLLFFIRKEDIKKPFNIVMLCVFLLYSIFLAGVPFQNMRFLILGFPLVIVFLFPAFKRAFHHITVYSALAAKILFGTLLVVQLALSARAIYPFWEMNKIERSISKELMELNPSMLYTFAMDVSLKSYGASFPMTNLRHDNIKNASKGEYVLFNEAKFSNQWRGKEVMNNWEELNRRFLLKEIRSFDHNWTLYELH